MLQIYIISTAQPNTWPKMLQIYSNSAAIAANLIDLIKNDADSQEFGQTGAHPKKNDVKSQHFQTSANPGKNDVKLQHFHSHIDRSYKYPNQQALQDTRDYVNE